MFRRTAEERRIAPWTECARRIDTEFEKYACFQKTGKGEGSGTWVTMPKVTPKRLRSLIEDHVLAPLQYDKYKKQRKSGSREAQPGRSIDVNNAIYYDVKYNRGSCVIAYACDQ